MLTSESLKPASRTSELATQRTRPPFRGRGNQRGVVLIWAAVSIMFIAGIIVAGNERIRALDRVTGADWSASGQATEIARAGLTDALAWLRRQTSQPVTNFQPARVGADRPSYLASPEAGWNQTINLVGLAVNETDDPDAGLVRAFEISPSLWAKYTVSTGTPAEPFVDEDGNGLWSDPEPYTDLNADGNWTPGTGTRDVTSQRGMAGNGAVWLLECTAEIYRRQRADLPLGEGPNRRIARATLEQEIRRMVISPPSAAALCCSDGQQINIGQRARIRGNGGNSIAFAAGTGTPQLNGSELQGLASSLPGWSASIEQVFGAPLAGLKSMADISTQDSSYGVPGVIPDFALVVVEDDIVFTEERPLRGTGVVIVKGNCTIDAGSNSFFSGLLYVEGDFDMRAPAYLRGTVIVTGDTDIRGTGGDYCEIEYDDTVVATLLTKMGQYRASKAPYTPSGRLSDGRPAESAGARTGTSPFGGSPIASGGIGISVGVDVGGGTSGGSVGVDVGVDIGDGTSGGDTGVDVGVDIGDGTSGDDTGIDVGGSSNGIGIGVGGSSNTGGSGKGKGKGKKGKK